MTNYTPTTEQVRNIYASERENEIAWDGGDTGQTIFETQAEFDRWYAEEIRKAKEEAWDEGFLLSTRNSPTQPHPMLKLNPYRKEKND